ncbi:glycosyl hydrolase [Kiritimatiellota bacterium B12222]|nr:glycosyl hydrolase [Kiritimatiellota bacterium B12222]
MSFDFSRFKTPPADLRGAPFWSLNHDLNDHDRLREYIDAFETMGIGGYHLHVRCGLKNDYLGPDFLKAISAARDYGAQKGMLSYLYDEDTWPSGFAGGAVTTELTHRRRWVALQKGRPTEAESDVVHYICAYKISLNDQGLRIAHQRIPFEQGREEDWFLTQYIQKNDDRFNGAAYLNTLSKSAVQAFIDSTHEVYVKQFGGSFPADVPAIFTDEPQLAGNTSLNSPFEGNTHFAWTEDLRDSFATAYNVELLDILPEVVWPGVDGPSPWRWRFWDHLSERFASAYADTLGEWCEQHGIALTGHMMAEDSLSSQIHSLGECMRHYRSFQIPGIDLLCDTYKPQTVKQAVSVARQDGRAGVMSELYGVTNWDFPFSGHKRQGDWQAALGITLRVHHLSLLSMEGQSKRDFPASIGPQSPWYREYPVIEDHFARVGAALTTGRPLVRIGVIHSVESAWMRRGINTLDAPYLSKLNRDFSQRVFDLLDASLDFDFIAESLLPQQERTSDQPEMQVGEMAYQVIVIPELETIRKSTLESLDRLIKRGGQVVVMGHIPTRCDGELSDLPTQVLAKALRISPDGLSLVQALEPWRDYAIHTSTGATYTQVNSQLRQSGEERILFCASRAIEKSHTHPWGNQDLHNGYIRIRGNWNVTELDTADGSEKACSYHQEQAWTVVPWDIHPQSHRLLRLTPGTDACALPQRSWEHYGTCPEPTSVVTEEPNVLLLDHAAWRLNDENWQPAEDSLVTQRKLAATFSWPDWGQPYSVKDPGPRQRVTRKFEINCAGDFDHIQLVCERLNSATICLDGQPLATQPEGWWVDHDLPTMTLPQLKEGIHHLEITLELDAVDRHLEWCYLLGDFAVETQGAHAKLCPSGAPIYWGDVVTQGLPFYGGNLMYECTLPLSSAGTYALNCPHFGAALLRVYCDGKDCGAIYHSPWRVELGELSEGPHTLRICAYGNRYNSFGPLHNNRPDWKWWGPQSWDGTPSERNEIWQFKAAGILRAPLLEHHITE